MLSRTKPGSVQQGWRNASRRGWISAALASLALLASGAIVACTEPVASPLPVEQAAALVKEKGSNPVTSRNVGAFHNEFLDFAFPKVLAASTDGQHAVCRAIAQAMREWVAIRRIPVAPASIGDDVAGARCRAQQNPHGIARRSLAGDGTPIPELDPFVGEMAVAVAEGRSIRELSAFFDERVAYARAHFPAEEAEVVAATASVALSSAEYWDANYATQEQQLLEQMAVETYGRIESSTPPLSPRSPAGTPKFSLFTPPITRSDNWLTDQPWYPKARRVAGSDVRGALEGGIKGILGGWQGIGTGALIGGAASSANAIYAIVAQ